VVIHVRPSGERLPLLLQPDGLPDQDATIYTTTVLRARSGSHNTLVQALYAILAIYRFVASRQIDLEERIRTAEFLRLYEWAEFSQEAGAGVGTSTLAVTMNQALRFVAWRIRRRSAQLRDPATRADFESRAGCFLDEAAAQIPVGGSEGSRDPLDGEQRRLLVGILRSPAELERLWPSPFVRTRNELLLWWLLLLGHRIGEALSMLVSDLDQQSGHLTVERRHDSPDDPRPRQPVVKGRGRTLRIPPALVPSLSRYLALRAKLPLEHGFLFVAENLRPLSRSSVAKVFVRLTALNAALAPMTPHVLRHTWVAAFRVAGRRMGLREDEAALAEAVAMGWRDPASDRLYAVSQQAEVANAISLHLQEEMMGVGAWTGPASLTLAAQLLSLHAVQAQCRLPPSHSPRPLPGDELARLRSRAETAW